MKITLLPDIINKEEEYKAKEVQNCRKQGHNTQFLVYWKCYGNEHDQCIAEMKLLHAKEVI